MMLYKDGNFRSENQSEVYPRGKLTHPVLVEKGKEGCTVPKRNLMMRTRFERARVAPSGKLLR